MTALQDHVATDRAEIEEAYRRVLDGQSVDRRDVTVGGGRVHLLESGTGPPLVLLHGTTAAAGMFTPLLAEFDGLRALAPDRPGHGLSEEVDLPRQRFRAAVVAWVDQLLDTLELDATALLGHSGGGVWALWYALAHPERVARLVVIGPPAVPGTRCPIPLRAMATPAVGAVLSRAMRPTPEAVLRFAASMGEREALTNRPELVDLFVATGRRPEVDRVGRDELRAIASPLALVTPSGFRRRARIDADELGRLTTPTLVLWGEHEPLGGVAVAEAFSAMIPDARLEVLPGGHAPWLDVPAMAATAVGAFVR